MKSSLISDESRPLYLKASLKLAGSWMGSTAAEDLVVGGFWVSVGFLRMLASTGLVDDTDVGLPVAEEMGRLSADLASCK